MSVNWNTGFKTGILQILLNEWQFREPAYTWRLDRGGNAFRKNNNECLFRGWWFILSAINCVSSYSLWNSEVDGTFLDTSCIDLYCEGLVFSMTVRRL